MRKINSLAPYFKALVISGVLSSLLLLAPSLASAQSQELPEHPETQQLLPETTVGLFKLRNFSEFMEKAKNSSFGEMLQSESVSPLVGSFYENASRQYDNVSEQVGLSLEEVRSLPSGEITFGIIAPRRKDLAFVVIIETDEDNEAVNKAIDHGLEAFEEAIAKANEKNEGEANFEMESSENGFGVKIDKVLITGKEVYICKHQGLFIGCTSKEELENMFIRWSGAEVKKVRALSENRKFVTIAKRCSTADDDQPDARFFIDPIGWFKGASRGNVGANFAIALLPTLGLDGVLAAGGNLYIDHEDYESIGHGHLLLASPREGVLNALALKPADYTPEPWVPVEIANYLTTSWDVPQMMASIKEISDKIMEGKYDEFFEKMQNEIENRNMDFDVREDLIAHLSGRVSVVRPILSGAEMNGIGNVISFGISDVEKFEATLLQLSDNEELTSWWSEQEYSTIKYWTRSEEANELRAERIADRLERRKKRATDRGVELKEAGPKIDIRVPSPAIGIIGDQIVISDSEEFFKFAVDAFNGDKPGLAEDENFLKHMEAITKLLNTDLPAAVAYIDSPREIEFYLRAFGQDSLMDVIEAQSEKDQSGFVADMKASIDEHGFPAIEDIQQYLSTTGGVVTSDDSGYHFLFFQEKPQQ